MNDNINRKDILAKIMPKLKQVFLQWKFLVSGGQVVEFHEIEVTIMRLKFDFFMRSNLFKNIDPEVDSLIMRSKPKKALLANDHFCD